MEQLEAEHENADTLGLPPTGDGGAVFLSDMTDGEYDQFVLEEKQGWKPFYKQLKDIFKL